MSKWVFRRYRVRRGDVSPNDAYGTPHGIQVGDQVFYMQMVNEQWWDCTISGYVSRADAVTLELLGVRSIQG